MVTPTGSFQTEERGFALLESLVAVLVLTVLATSLLAGERSGSLNSRHSLEELLVVQALESRLDELRLAPNIEVGTHAFAPITMPFDLDGIRAAETVTPLSDRLLEVTVEIAWKPLGSDAERTRRLVSRQNHGGAR
ncbi:MAG: prepilin-type N-terminal cleavage/methylation domain-containing protein [Planctomycetota bacterium]